MEWKRVRQLFAANVRLARAVCHEVLHVFFAISINNVRRVLELCLLAKTATLDGYLCASA